MSGVRIRYNFDVLRALPRSEGAARVVMAVARAMDAALIADGAQTKVDAQAGHTRFRAAVITGYEDGATAEGSREALLRALDAPGGGHG